MKNGKFEWREGVSLKEYFEQKITDLNEKIDLKFKSIDTAVGLARVQMEKRLEGMNEFREQLKDQAGQFLTRDVYESRHQALQNQLDELRIFRANLDGKASQTSVMIALAISLIGIFIAIFDFITRMAK